MNMKNILLPLLFVLSAIILGSCTKVIDVKLKDADKKYVVEGMVTDQPGSGKIILSQTKNFSDNNAPGMVSGAVVTITDNNTGTVTAMTETTPGNYTDATLTGISGHTYALRITTGGSTFTSVSTMPVNVHLDTLYMTNENVFGSNWNLANIEFRDPAGTGNCYRARQFVNGKKSKDIFITNDDYTDGKLMFAKLYMDPGGDDENKIKSGDAVTVEMTCIDPSVYKYWFSLQQSATGNSQSAAPANPVTNIEGGALGYFSAHTLQSRSVTTP